MIDDVLEPPTEDLQSVEGQQQGDPVAAYLKKYGPPKPAAPPPLPLPTATDPVAVYLAKYKPAPAGPIRLAPVVVSRPEAPPPVPFAPINGPVAGPLPSLSAAPPPAAPPRGSRTVLPNPFAPTAAEGTELAQAIQPKAPTFASDATRLRPEANPYAQQLTGKAKTASDVFQAMADNPVRTATAIPVAPFESALTAGRYLGQQISSDPSADADASRAMGIDPVTGTEAIWAGAQLASLGLAPVLGKYAGLAAARGTSSILGRVGQGALYGERAALAPWESALIESAPAITQGIAGTVEQGVSGGVVGAAYDPEKPLRGAAVGAGLGIIGNEVAGAARRRAIAGLAATEPAPRNPLAEDRASRLLPGRTRMTPSPIPDVAPAGPDYTVEEPDYAGIIAKHTPKPVEPVAPVAPAVPVAPVAPVAPPPAAGPIITPPPAPKPPITPAPAAPPVAPAPGGGNFLDNQPHLPLGMRGKQVQPLHDLEGQQFDPSATYTQPQLIENEAAGWWDHQGPRRDTKELAAEVGIPNVNYADLTPADRQKLVTHWTETVLPQLPTGGAEGVDRVAAGAPVHGPEEAFEKAATGRPFDATLMRGEGKEGSPYNPLGAQVPLLGKGRYTTPDEGYARSFGNTLTTHRVTLHNPLVIDSDAQWRELTDAAGWPYPNPFGGDPARAQTDIDKLRALIEAKGHDGVVVRVPQDERTGKTLQKLFGADQALEFRPKATAPKAAPTEAATPDRNDLTVLQPGDRLNVHINKPTKFDNVEHPTYEQGADVVEVHDDGTVSVRGLGGKAIKRIPQSMVKSVARKGVTEYTKWHGYTGPGLPVTATPAPAAPPAAPAEKTLADARAAWGANRRRVLDLIDQSQNARGKKAAAIHEESGRLHNEGVGLGRQIEEQFGPEGERALLEEEQAIRQARDWGLDEIQQRRLDALNRELGAPTGATAPAGEFTMHHLFDAPADTKRLQDKVRVYVSEHGWMTPAEAKATIAGWQQHAAAQLKDGRNAKKWVLSLFDLTGEWSQPWEDAGYNVVRFDIQRDPTMEDVTKFSSEFFADSWGDFEGEDIHAILAACPCTDFASSGARHFAAKDADGRTEASIALVHHTLATIEHFKPSVWVIENPVGRIEKLTGMPPWRLSLDPNHVGDPYTKKTLLWGRFNADLPIAPVEPTEGSKMHAKYGGKSQATKNARSATPEGFAYSFFMANNAIDHPVDAVANKYDRLSRDVIAKAVDAGLTDEEIAAAVDDPYYMELDDKAAERALTEAIAEKTKGAPTAAPVDNAGEKLSADAERYVGAVDAHEEAIMNGAPSDEIARLKATHRRLLASLSPEDRLAATRAVYEETGRNVADSTPHGGAKGYAEGTPREEMDAGWAAAKAQRNRAYREMKEAEKLNAAASPAPAVNPESRYAGEENPEALLKGAKDEALAHAHAVEEIRQQLEGGANFDPEHPPSKKQRDALKKDLAYNRSQLHGYLSEIADAFGQETADRIEGEVADEMRRTYRAHREPAAEAATDETPHWPFTETARRKVGGGAKTTPADQIDWQGQWAGVGVALRSTVRNINADESFMTSSNARIQYSPKIPHYVDIEVRHGDLSPEAMQSLADLVIRMGETRPVMVRAKGAPVRTGYVASPPEAESAALPPRTADTMSDAIAMSSPSGRMSQRAREAASARLAEKLFGPGGATREQIQGGPTPQPTEAERLRAHAARLRDLAGKGMHPKKYARLADEAEQQAAALERGGAAPTDAEADAGVQIVRMPVADIIPDPTRFQYKREGDEETGAGAELKGLTKFDEHLAGVISVWRDPETGIVHPVNGHNRIALAKRLGHPSVNVQVLPAKTANEARAMGALANIAEGRGSALDAAQFFRSSGLGASDLADRVSMKGPIMRQGIGLAKLPDDLFHRVETGDIPESHGAILGAELGTPALMRTAAQAIDRGGKRLSDAEVREVARQVRDAGTENVTEESLFGSETQAQPLFVEKAQLAALIKKRLAADKRLFGFVAKEGRAEALARGGNVIDTRTSGAIASESAQLEEVFNALYTRSGPIATALTEAARQVAHGAKPSTLIDALYPAIREAVTQAVGRPRGPGGAALAGGEAARGGAVGAGGAGGYAAPGEAPARATPDTGVGPEDESQAVAPPDPNQSGFFEHDADYGSDLFGNAPEPVKERTSDQPSMFGAEAGTAASRSLKETEAAARAELDKLNQKLEAMQLSRYGKRDLTKRLSPKDAARKAELERLVNRNEKISQAELANRRNAEGDGGFLEPSSPAAVAADNAHVTVSMGSREEAGLRATELVRESPAVAVLREKGLPVSAERIDAIRLADRRAFVSTALRGQVINSPEQAAQLLHPFRSPRYERLHAILLAPDGTVLAHNMETSGSIGTVAIEPKRWVDRLIRRAEKLGATRVILGHNHPSGSPSPSREDIDLTHAIGYYLQQHGLTLDGHVVIDHTRATWLSADEPRTITIPRVDPAAPDWTQKRAPSTISAREVAALVANALPARGFLALYLNTNLEPVAIEPHRESALESMPDWVPAGLRAHAARRVILAGHGETGQALSRAIADAHRGLDADGGNGEWANHVADVIVFASPTSSEYSSHDLARAGSRGDALTSPIARRVFAPEVPYGEDEEGAGVGGEAAEGGAAALPGDLPGDGSAAGAAPGRPDGAGGAGGVPPHGGVTPATAGAAAHPMPEPSGLTQHGGRVSVPDIIHAVKALFNPESLGADAKGAAGSLRAANAAGYRELVIAQEALRSWGGEIDKMPRAQQVDYWDKAERGESVGNAAHDAGNKLLHAVTEKFTDALIARGLLRAEKAIEYYIGRFWSKPTTTKGFDFLRAIMSRRPLRGTQSFLKQRDLERFTDGLDAGLVPATYNYVEAQLAKIREMQRVISAADATRAEQAAGRMVPVMDTQGMYAPFDTEGERFVRIGQHDDPAFTIYGPPEMPVHEAFDAAVREGLNAAIERLRKLAPLEHLRAPSIGMGPETWGYAAGGKKIATKFGGDATVIMHELGHILDNRYGLWDLLRDPPAPKETVTLKSGKRKGQTVTRNVKQDAETVASRKKVEAELRALADLRSKDISKEPEHHKQYLRNRYEKMANAFHAFIYAPELMEQVAPTVKARMAAFIASHPETAPIADIKPSLRLGSDTKYVELPGLRIMGHWYAPKGAAAVWNNNLSIVGPRARAIIDAYMAPAQFAAQMVLGLSGFHVTVIATEGIFSDLALAIDAAANPGAKVSTAPRHLLHALGAPVRTALHGRRIMQEYRLPGTHPEYARVLDAMIQGGYRGTAASEFWTGERKVALKRAWRDALYADAKTRKLWGAARLPFDALWAGMEFLTSLVMGKYVPWMKTGALANLTDVQLQKFDTLPGEVSLDDFRRIMGDANKEMDYRFGQVVYDNHFMDNMVKMIAQMLFLAPGWTGGTVTLAGRGVIDAVRMLRVLKNRVRPGAPRVHPAPAPNVPVAERISDATGETGELPDGEEEAPAEEPAEPAEVPPELIGKSAAYWLGAVAGTMVINGILTYLNTGEHPSGMDFFAYRDGRIDEEGNQNRHTIPGYLMHDIYGWTHHPTSTFANKLSPNITTGRQLLTNRDQLGNMVYDPDASLATKAKQIGLTVAKGHVPISVSNYLQSKARTQATDLRGKAAAVVQSGFGIAPAKRELTRTAAQNLIMSYQFHGAPLTPQEVEALKGRRELSQRARAGTLTDAALDSAQAPGVKHPITDRQRMALETERDEADTRDLWLERYSRLTVDQALKVYHKANPDERRKYYEVLDSKLENADRSDELPPAPAAKRDSRVPVP